MTLSSSKSTSGSIPKRIKSGVSKRHLYTHVHSSTTHKSQEAEATPVSVSGQAGKRNATYTYNKKGSLGTCRSMGGPREHDAE